MSLKKKIVSFSFLFLAVFIFTSCEKTTINNEIGIEEVELYAADKDNSGSIGNSGGQDSDDDYN